jgi:putative transposase
LYYDRYDRAPEGKIKQGTFKYNGLHWYVCIVTEIEIPEQESQNDTLPTVISQTIADNQRYILVGDQEILVPKFMDSELVAYKRLSRRLSRCTKDSKRYAKAHKKLLAFSIMIANRRKDFLHKLTTSIINTHNSIEIKSEDIRKKIQGNRWHQNRLLYDLAWGMLEAQLKYKTQWHGKKLVIEK